MTYSRSLGQYKRLNVETAGKLDLVLMCYEKAIELLRQARKCYEEGQFEHKARKLQKALDILHELQGCLNYEEGGQIANNLSALYTYLIRRILEGDIQRDLKAFDEATRILSELKEAWQEIASQRNLQADPGAPASRSAIDFTQLAA
jgi:flagellar secretion chaperone FliS